MAYKAPIWEDGKSPAISAENLNNLSQAAEGAQVLYGNSAPTFSTEGAVGQFYLVVVADSDGSYPLYQCVAIANGRYVWRDTRSIPDSIALMLGISGPSTINSALNVLANVGNLHVWEEVQTYADPVPEVPAGYTLGEVEENVVLASRKTTISTTGAFYYYYGDSVTVKNDGTVNAPSSDSWAEIGRDVSATTIKSGPLFVKGSSSYISSGSGHQAVDVTNEATKVFYIPSGGTLSVTVDSNAKMCYVVATKYQPVTGYPYTPAIPAGTHTDYLTSTDRLAYPNYVTDGHGAYITYLGQLGGCARIEVGSYVGTGTYGSSNPCSVTASFPIKQLSVFGEVYANTGNYFPIYQTSGYSSYSMHDILLTTSFASRRGIHNGTSNYALDYSFGKKSVDGRTFWWYSSGNAASFQLNETGSTYYYIAIG